MIQRIAPASHRAEPEPRAPWSAPSWDELCFAIQAEPAPAAADGAARAGEASTTLWRVSRGSGATAETLDANAFSERLRGGGAWCIVDRADCAPLDACATTARGAVVSLLELAELLAPAQWPRQSAELGARLLSSQPATASDAHAASPLAHDEAEAHAASASTSALDSPAALRTAFAALVRRFVEGPRAARRVLAWAGGRALERCAAQAASATIAAAAADLALALALVDEPARWARDAAAPAGGWLAVEWPLGAKAPPRVENLPPRWADAWTELRRREPIPAQQVEPHGFDEVDLALVDRVFEHALPRALEELGAHGTRRASQHEVARGVARTLGRKRLLLVHAPTGTGKTLAYLVPVMIWALRQRVRVGIATFTRALQEQAMERDVPIALRALEAAGAGGVPDVAMLKGRANYLCWRALAAQAPDTADSAGAWLAWSHVVLFGLQDASGDLDKLGARCNVPGGMGAGAASRLDKLLADVRAQPACCTTKEDRETCAAEGARRRAERSHVVITNHSFALARREFFRHVVFDECEHLHDQARSAFSSEVALRDVRDVLWRLRRPKAPPERSPLLRIQSAAFEGGDAHTCARQTLETHASALEAHAALDACIAEFRDWRDEALRLRDEKDSHSLFREYALSSEGSALLDAQAALSRALDELGAKLAQLAEHLDTLPLRGASRLRRALDLARGELVELQAGVALWIPRQNGAPRFAPETFYDAESDGGGEGVLVARVLLPHEYLGRAYFPDLDSAVCISATTWLRGGFEASARYLGLWRAAHPSADEERAPSELDTLKADEIFDYERVLVLVPRDAPLPSQQGGVAHSLYVQRFIAHLAERTRGRMLVLFTNAEACIGVGRKLVPFFAARGIPFWYQRMPGAGKEELAELFRARRDSVLLGLDTFWYGADFPGETLEYLVIVKLPYGVPDRYHHAQCATLGADEQRRTIYLPRALAKFRQGFGRLMRRETDRGCVFVLDGRSLEPRHRLFLAELPLQALVSEPARLARFVRQETDTCVREALVHMGRLDEVRARGLAESIRDTRLADERSSDARALESDADTPF